MTSGIGGLPADRDQALVVSPDSPRPAAGPGTRSRSASITGILGIVVAVLAVGFCARVLVREWPHVTAALRHANVPLLVTAALVGAAAMWLLAVLWWRCLAVFGSPRRVRDVSTWFFAGELGKYLPGGIWPVVGRGELARRGGVPRSTAYATTVLSLALMCVGAGIASGILVPVLVLVGGRLGPELLLVALVPLGLAMIHPAVLGRLLAMLARVSRGRVRLQAPAWGQMLGLIALSVPTWLAVGGASAVITQALGFGQQPARVAFAAIVAWILGFLVLPVPAGAGIRELMFVAICGLSAGPATVVATMARIVFIVVDGTAGTTALLMLRRHRGRPAGPPQEADAGGPERR